MTKKPLITIALILLGVVIIVFFGMRAVHAFRKFNGHRPPPPGSVETDVSLIRDWMTVPFISRMYHVPDKAIFDALNISPFSNHDKSLKKINQEYFPNKNGYVLDLVKNTVLVHQPPPTPAAAHETTPIPPLTATVTP
jgi:hypothetical protein